MVNHIEIETVAAAASDRSFAMLRAALIAVSAFALTACGGEEPDEAAMDHGAGHEAMGGEGAAPAALPDDGVTPVIRITASWIRPHLGGNTVTAAYFAATLTEGSGDRLLSARIEGAERVELHGHTMDDQGVMRMRPSGPRDLGPDAPVIFQPGGLHLMVFGLPTVSEGDEVNGVLVFERAGEIAVSFEARNLMPESMPTDY
jgi:copper(I)-binding protein